MLEKILLVETLRSALEYYKFQLRTITAFFIISGDSGQIPLELWPSWRHEEDVFLCHMVPPVPTAQRRNLLSDHVFHQEDLFAPATLVLLDMPHGMCPYHEDHSLGLPHLLGRLSGGTSLRLRHPGDALNLRLLLLRRRALKPSSWTRFTPQKKSPDPPRGVFGDRSLS